MTTTVRKALAAIATLLWWSLFLAVAVMLGCVAFQVVMRYVFHRAPSWTEELAVLMFAWASLGALALGIREGFHVKLSLLLDTLSTGRREVADRVLDGLSAAIGLFLAWSGWRFVDMTSGTVSAAVGYPIEVLHVMAPVCGILVFMFGLERALLGVPPAEPESASAIQL